MALTSASTVSDALGQYNDNLSWEGSTAKALLALEAVRWLLVNRPASASDGGASLNYASLEVEKSRLESYVNTVGGTSRRSYFVRGRPSRA